MYTTMIASYFNFDVWAIINYYQINFINVSIKIICNKNYGISSFYFTVQLPSLQFPTTSGVPQESILGRLFSNLYTNNVSDNLIMNDSSNCYNGPVYFLLFLV